MREKYKNLWGLWVRAHAIIKNEGSLGDGDAEKGGLLSLTYASPPEWDCPPGGKNNVIKRYLPSAVCLNMLKLVYIALHCIVPQLVKGWFVDLVMG